MWLLTGTLAISAMLYFFNKAKLLKANWKKSNIIKFGSLRSWEFVKVFLLFLCSFEIKEKNKRLPGGKFPI